MPLPLPHLDTRRWQDLVDEGRALIPVYAPEWTDHNASDPGITLMELFAFLVEQLVYRANQIPERHRRKFLALVGYPTLPPQPGRGVLQLALKPAQAAVTLPKGLTLAGRIPLAGQQATPGVLFRTRREMLVSPAAIQAVQVFDGAVFTNLTATWREGESYAAWGGNPSPEANAEAQPALYIGFDQSLPVGKTFNLWLEFANPGSSGADRERLLAETAGAAVACRPEAPGWPCPPGSGGGDPTPTSAEPILLPHHTVRAAWEYFDGAHWQVLDPVAGRVVDATRSFTLSGLVQVTLPTAMAAAVFGVLKQPANYLRCRMLSGPPDGVPRIRSLFSNAVDVEQAQTARYSFAIKKGVTPPAGQEPQVGQTGKIDLALDSDGFIVALALGAGAGGPEVLVQDYTPATNSPGRLVVTLVPAGISTGYPLQQYDLPFAPVAADSLRLWTREGNTWQKWNQEPDFDSCGQQARTFTLDPTRGKVRFGDGLHGLVPPEGAPIFAAYDITSAASGNLPARAAWQLAGEEDLLNGCLLGASLQPAVQALAPAANPVPVSGGADEEAVSHAAGRAATALYAHERLLELSESLQVTTLDQVAPERRLALAEPQRATTLLDYERLSLEVPGTCVARARAWAGLDPNYPCFQVPGTVSVVIVPELPARRPAPTDGLLRTVRAYLGRRKLVGTRLVVCGPKYLEVVVEAAVQLNAGANAALVQDQVIRTLNTFLDPLAGGPDGLGWPFGRGVYRSEILQVIDHVPGVDHVLSLELKPSLGEPRCDNLCVGPLGLVTPGQHTVTVA